MTTQSDLARISLQESTLRFPRFDEATAWALGSRLRTLALERSLPVVIDVRRFGLPLFYAALPGTTPDNPEWVRRKSNLTARFLRSSYAIGISLQLAGSNLTEKYGLSPAEFVSHGGSFPIHVIHAGVLGSVTVSGLPQRQDHELVVEALCLELGHDYSTLRLD